MSPTILCVLAVVCAGLDCPEPRHDAGTVRTGVRLAHSFTLRNTGDAQATITSIKPGCGCVTATPSARVIPPGGKVVVRMEVGTVTQAPGPNNWGALVRHAGGEVRLAIVADLKADLSLSPASMVLMASSGISHPFTLTERRPEAMKLLGVSCSSPHLKAEAGTPRREGGAWVREIKVRVLPTMPEGRHEDALVVLTGDALCPELRVPVSVVKRSAGLKLIPAAVEARREPGGAVPSRIVFLEAGVADVRIKRITAGHPALKATWSDGGERATLRVTIDGDKVGAEGLSSELVIEANGKSVRLPVRVSPSR